MNFLLIKLLKAKPNIVHLISMIPIIINFSSLFVKSGYCATLQAWGFYLLKGIKGFILRTDYQFFECFLILKNYNCCTKQR